MTDPKFINYGKQWIDEDDERAILRVLRSDFLTQGPEIEAFERELAEYTGAKFAVTVANGTAALHLSVLALDLPADSICLTSPITFAATANACVYGGLKPTFSDVEAETQLITIDTIQSATTNKKIDLILPVHYAGRPTDTKRIAEVAAFSKSSIIEDAAHSIGARYADGTKVGGCAHSDLTIFSFHPVKTITTGEGGAVTTNDLQLYSRLCELRTHGITKDISKLSTRPGPWYYEMQSLGYNYRMSELHAALGRSQLAKLDQFVERRRAMVSRYNDAFSDLTWLSTPAPERDEYAAWHLYTVQIDWKMIGTNRATVMERLAERGIGTQVHYIPVHLQPWYRTKYGFSRGDFPVAEAYYDRALSLPLYAKMSDDDQLRVIDEVRNLQ